MNICRLAELIPSHILTKSFFYSRVLIPLGMLSFYFAAFSLLLPEGVNRAFVASSGKYVVPTTIYLWIVFFAIHGLRKVYQQRRRASGEKELSTGTNFSLPGRTLNNSLQPVFSIHSTQNADTRPSASDLLLLFLPLTPVMQHIINNTDILSFFESVLVFCVFALCVSLPILVIPFLLGNTDSARPAMSVGLAFAFSITNMASLSQQFAWHQAGSLTTQLAVFGVVWSVSWLLFHLKYRSLLYLLAVVYFAANSVFQLVTPDDRPSVAEINSRPFATELDETDNRLVTLIDARVPVITPSIYLLIYDAYVVNETMLGYGIDNGAQEQYLEALGFQIYPHIYSVGADSLGTMERVLNVSADFDYYGNARQGVSGDGVVQNLLKRFGYKTYGVFPSDFFFRGVAPSYDYSFPGRSSSASVLLEAICVGEFRFDINFDRVSRKQFVEEKHGIFFEASKDPMFIYTHSNFPSHSQNSRVCLPNEVELYGERLANANLEMRQDVETIIENDPQAIVIVAGDHGPYLTKGCYSTGNSYDISEMSRLDIQDRFGTFLAIRWPTVDFEEYDDITVLQDLFPVIFAYIFEEPGLLEAKVEPVTIEDFKEKRASGAAVVEGVIRGGIDDGEPLFTGGSE